MYKRLAIIIGCFVLFFKVNAQTSDTYKSNITAEIVNFSVPYEDFGNTDILAKSGFAKAGLRSGFASYNLKLRKKFGISLRLGGTVNKFNTTAFTQQFALFRPAINNSYSISGSVSNWETLWLGAGVFWQYPIFKQIKNGKMYFFDRIYLAYVTTNSPRYNLIASSPTNQYRFAMSSKTSGSFGMQVGIGLLLNILNDRLGISLTADYYYTQPTFNPVNVTEVSNNVADNYLVTYSRKVDVYAFSLGVGYNFGKGKK